MKEKCLFLVATSSAITKTKFQTSKIVDSKESDLCPRRLTGGHAIRLKILPNMSCCVLEVIQTIPAVMSMSWILH